MNAAAAINVIRRCSACQFVESFALQIFQATTHGSPSATMDD
jgi:hypothetical protein